MTNIELIKKVVMTNIELIKKVVMYKKDLDASFEQLSRVFNGVEGELYETSYKILDSLQEHTSTLVGDEEGWLDYYLYECDCGASPKTVGITNSEGAEIEILLETEEQLVELIEFSKQA